MDFENADVLLDKKDNDKNARILTQMMRNTNDASIYKQIYNKLIEEKYPERLVVSAISSARYANEERAKKCSLAETEAMVRYILQIMTDDMAKEEFRQKKMRG